MARLRLLPASGSPHEIDKDEVVIGREPTVDVVVPDGSVSRKHARIQRRGLTWAVIDQGSANGTYLDSHRVAEAVLRNGQELRVGAVAFRVQIEGPADDGSTLGRPAEAADATLLQPTPAAPPPPPLPVAAPPPPPARVSPPPPPPPRTAGPPSPPTGPQPSLPTPMAASPAPARKGKGPVFWALLGCGGCLGMVVLFVMVLGGGLYFMTKGAVDSVQAPIEALRSGSIDVAYEHLSEDYKARVSRQDFAALIEAHPGLKDNAEANFWPPAGSVSVVNDRAQITGTLVSKSGVREKIAFELVKEGGAWKISSLSVDQGS